MNPTKRFTWAIIKTIFTQITLLGILFAGVVIYSLIYNLQLKELILKFNNTIFYANNLILILIIGMIFLFKAKEENIDF